jgi:hypothetical protein
VTDLFNQYHGLLADARKVRQQIDACGHMWEVSPIEPFVARIDLGESMGVKRMHALFQRRRCMSCGLSQRRESTEPDHWGLWMDLELNWRL